ncbi:A-kinase-interacting protein 1 isoform X3 [Hippocampus comes]|uniref:A-kinase-interacting protein 1 isoform X3 n=1 Tax=Hippocampus comes TaxID=109280 RepID=UPI00094E6A3A|nr:PREDICTED: A-kinase-interacting protein 1 isoform X3 [Hippocampus comes]
MATLASLEHSLRQSARRGREVLERASRRKVDWGELPHTYTPVADEDRAVYSKRFYDSVGCSQGSNIEKKHVPRYHKHIGATKIESSSQLRQHGRSQGQGPPDDFYMEVAPGLYTISASRPGSQQQTQMIDLDPGDTVSVTFNL